MGKMSPSPRIVYFLFTKIDCCKQKMHLSAHKRSTGILNCPILLFFGVGWGKKPHPIIVVYLVTSVDLIKPPFAAKILDEPIAIFKNTVYNVSNKSADCGKNIRWRLLWRLKETFI